LNKGNVAALMPALGGGDHPGHQYRVALAIAVRVLKNGFEQYCKGIIPRGIKTTKKKSAQAKTSDD